ncbi:hypothetical protein D9757_001820 [Collybiopsis confluens]|uniref:HMG box domain-containing protein n=1 Tax=Collybiopsis confluens TaxID=2823264 RepID=A0A8H5HYE5_9AGAR|nr:hypothetical protein D9757_001820 [Collybiopsis confluens]
MNTDLNFPGPVFLPQLPQPHPVSDAPPPRIPRPPNAFMLFRSDLLRKKAIPQSAERRQQQLSKVAGECWSLLPLEKKQYWHDEAAKQLREHQLKYPDYKFTPATRGSGRKGKDKNASDDPGKIRALREKWTHIYGPAAPSSRRKKPKQKKDGNDPESLDDASASSSPSMSLLASPSASIDQASLPPVFPDPSFPHFANNTPQNTEIVFMNQYRHPVPLACPSPSAFDALYMAPSPSYDSSSSTPSSLYTAPSSPSSDAGFSAGGNTFDIAPSSYSYPGYNVYSPALRQPPSFTVLSGNRGPSEPPFLSPLVPPPSELIPKPVAQPPFENIPTVSYSPEPHDFDSLRLETLDYQPFDTRLFFDPSPMDNDNRMDFGSWSVPSQGFEPSMF